MRNCVFKHNYSVLGGAINNFASNSNVSVEEISNCIFYQNTAVLSTRSNSGQGGAISNAGCNLSILNSVFAENNATNYGAAIYNTGLGSGAYISSNSTINNCTFSNNQSGIGGNGIYNQADALYGVCNTTITNSIFRNGSILNTSSANTSISYSNIQSSYGSGASWVASNGTDAGNNIDANPLFVNAADPDGADNIFATTDDGLSLQAGSPCINTGTNTLAPPTDITGVARPSGGTADMGAYEYSVATLTITASAGTGGNISPNGITTVLYSSNKTYTIIANTGYCIQNVLVDGASVGAVATYTFTSITSSHTIAASFVARTTPSISIIAARNNVCYGATNYITATPTNGGIAPLYNFYVDGVAQGNSAAPTFNTSLLSVGSHIVYCVMTSNNVCQTSNIVNSNAININVGNISVLPSIGGVINSCVIGTTSRLSNAIGAGVWSSSDAGIATINSTSGVVTSVAAGVTNITFTYTNSFGCVSTTNTNFNVAPIGNIEQITGNSNVCIGSSINLSNATPGGVWSSIAGRATINASGVVTGVSNGVAQIRYTLSNAFGCSAYVGKLVSVNAIPAVPSLAYAPGYSNPTTAGGFCTNRIFGVVGSPTGGTWNSTGVITISPLGVISTGSVAGASSFTYTYNAGGCSNSRTIARNIILCTPRGIANNGQLTIDNLQFTMYPNPARSVVNLQVDRLIGAGSIVVTDLYGKQIKTQPLSMGTNTIDVSSFAKGIYFISTITNEGKITKKLVVE